MAHFGSHESGRMWCSESNADTVPGKGRGKGKGRGTHGHGGGLMAEFELAAGIETHCARALRCRCPPEAPTIRPG